MNVVECTKELVRVQLNQDWVDLLAQVGEVLLDAIEIRGDVVHDDV